MSQHQQNEEPRPTSEPPPSRGGVRVGILSAAVTFAAFAGYAFLAPPTYHATALVVIESSGADSSTLSPLEAARRLHEAVLDREVLSRLSSDQAPGAAPDVHIQIARTIQAAFQIESVDGHTFSVSFRDSDSDRVERRCNELATRAVERGPRLLAPEHGEAARKLENERRQRVNELVVFLASHPELASAAQDKEAASDSTDTELRVERARLEARLAPRATPGASDNPYADPATVDVDAAALTRRLVEINAAIAARHAPKAKAAARQAAPQVTAEWQRLLAEVARARIAADAAKNTPVTFKARLLSRAVAPTWPVEPNRRLWLLWGAVAGLGAFVLGVLAARALGSRAQLGGYSSFPPAPGPVQGSSFPPPPGWPTSPVASSGPPPLPLPSEERLQMRSPLPQVAPEPSSQAPLPVLPYRNVTSSSAPPLPMPAYGGEQEPAAGTPDVHHTPSHGAAAYSGRRSERAFRAAVEVNAEMLAPTPAPAPAPAPTQRPNSSTPPLHSVAPTSARTTQVLGSPIPPIIAPGSRRTPSAGAGFASPRATPSPRTTTGYSYVSTPPPFAPNAPASSGPSAPASPRPTTISTRPAAPGWRPDLSLLPESRRGLCDDVYPQAVDRCLVIAVLDGADNAEAKSRLAAELALALAESGHPRVLVLEGNLQRPAVRRFLRVEMPAGHGLSEQLLSRIEVRQRQPWSVVECTASLHVLAEGAKVAPELILSRPFEDCVTELRSFYDFIVLDGPALSDVRACRAVNDVIDSAVLLSGPSAVTELAQASLLFPSRRISVVAAPP